VADRRWCDISAFLADDTHTAPAVALRDNDPIRLPHLHAAGVRQEAILMLTLASSYPFLDILWTILIVFALGIWIWMVIMAMIDIFSRSDISGWSKAAWVVLIIVLPFIGVLCYLVVYSAGIAERRA